MKRYRHILHYVAWVWAAIAMATVGCEPDEDDVRSAVGLEEMAEPGGDTIGETEGPPCGVAPAGPAGPAGEEAEHVDPRLVLKGCDAAVVGLGEVLCGSSASVLQLAAGGCDACLAQAEALQAEVASTYAADAVRVVTVLLDGAESLPPTAAGCEQWVADAGATWPVLYDPPRTLGPLLGPGDEPIPTLVLLDEGLRVVDKRAGGEAGDVAELLQQLDAAVTQGLAQQ